MNGLVVGPQCGIGFEIHGTDGSVTRQPVPAVQGANFGRTVRS
ncbi:hypothetical protein R6V09_38850 [Streptomyces sp. W16]|nr:hypothetical protein [Streptomyces sp. W16]MDV9176068.1 hypothetical protein [Streptomyces sp. W16]